MTADRLPGHDDDADDLALINAVMAMPFDDCTRWRCKRTRLTRWGMAMSEGQSGESGALTGGVEPQRVGTRIEDGKGRRWVRVHPSGGPAPWWLIDADEFSDSWAVWSAIPEPTYVTPPGEGRITQAGPGVTTDAWGRGPTP